MTELLSTLAGLTLGGSAAVGVLTLTTRLSRTRYGARWRCWVWLLLCLRLAVPLSIPMPTWETPPPAIHITAPSDRVLYTYRPAPNVTITPPTPEPPAMEDPEPTQPTPAPLEPAPAEPIPQREITLFDLLGVLWLVGVAAVLGWCALSHLRFLTYVRRWGEPVSNGETIRIFNTVGDSLGLDRRPGLYVCTGLAVPLLAGLFRPRLLLPEGEMGETALRCSMLHELTHYKRRDIWLKTVALVAAAVHWFNPLMWYMIRLVERDTELACDEAALKHLPPEEHSLYGKTILDAVERLKYAGKEEP